MYKGQSRKKDSHRQDTTVSSTGTSLCTYAIEPPCTEQYARWCERTGLFSPSYSIGKSPRRVIARSGHPQGVRRIRKAAKPPTAAQPRARCAMKNRYSFHSASHDYQLFDQPRNCVVGQILLDIILQLRAIGGGSKAPPLVGFVFRA